MHPPPDRLAPASSSRSFVAAMLLRRDCAGRAVNLARARASPPTPSTARSTSRGSWRRSDPPREPGADLGKAWCVRGDTHRSGAEIAFAWDEEVTIGEVVYYGGPPGSRRSAGRVPLFLDNDASPALEASSRWARPQRLALPRRGGRRACGSGSPPRTEDSSRRGEIRSSLSRARRRPPRSSQAARGAPSMDLVEEIEESPEMVAAPAGRSLGFDAGGDPPPRDQPDPRVHAARRGFAPGGGSASSTRGRGASASWSPRRRVRSSTARSPSTEAGALQLEKNPGGGLPIHIVTPTARGCAGSRRRWHDYKRLLAADGGIAFLTTRKPQFAYCWISPVGSSTGSSPTARPGAALGQLPERLHASVLDDGRIIYGRWSTWTGRRSRSRALDDPSDGTRLTGFYGTAC